MYYVHLKTNGCKSLYTNTNGTVIILTAHIFFNKMILAIIGVVEPITLTLQAMAWRVILIWNVCLNNLWFSYVEDPLKHLLVFSCSSFTIVINIHLIRNLALFYKRDAYCYVNALFFYVNMYVRLTLFTLYRLLAELSVKYY